MTLIVPTNASVPTSVPAGIDFAQSITTVSPSVSITMTGVNVTSPNELVILWVTVNGNHAVNSVTDLQQQTWTLRGNATFIAGTGYSNEWYTIPSGTLVNDQITVSVSGGLDNRMVMTVVSVMRVNTNQPFDVLSPTIPDTGTGSATAPTLTVVLTPVYQTHLVLAMSYINCTCSSGLTPNAPLSLVNYVAQGQNLQGLAAWLDTTGGGTYTFSFQNVGIWQMVVEAVVLQTPGGAITGPSGGGCYVPSCSPFKTATVQTIIGPLNLPIQLTYTSVIQGVLIVSAIILLTGLLGSAERRTLEDWFIPAPFRRKRRNRSSLV